MGPDPPGERSRLQPGLPGCWRWFWSCRVLSTLSCPCTFGSLAPRWAEPTQGPLQPPLTPWFLPGHPWVLLVAVGTSGRQSLLQSLLNPAKKPRHSGDNLLQGACPSTSAPQIPLPSTSPLPGYDPLAGGQLHRGVVVPIEDEGG